MQLKGQVQRRSEGEEEARVERARQVEVVQKHRPRGTAVLQFCSAVGLLGSTREVTCGLTRLVSPSKICSELRFGLTDSISEATPETMGVEKLVPASSTTRMNSRNTSSRHRWKSAEVGTRNHAITSMSNELGPNSLNVTVMAFGQMRGRSRRTRSMPRSTCRICSRVVS